MTKHAQKYIDAQSKLLDPRTREIEPAAGDMGCAELSVRQIDADARTIEAVVSTPEVDRYQEIVEPTAFRKWLDHFNANPVMLAAHDHSAWSTGEPTVIGKWFNVRIEDKGLIATGQFMDGDDLAERYWRRYRDGYMRAFSVGFIAHSWEMREFELAPGVTKRIRVFTEAELLEISAVAVPANRAALARAASFIAGRGLGQDDAAQSAAIAKALHDEISKHVREAIAAERTASLSAISDAIKKQLDPQPGGPLHSLLIDIADTLCLSSGATGGHVRDVPLLPQSDDALSSEAADAINRVKALFQPGS